MFVFFALYVFKPLLNFAFWKLLGGRRQHVLNILQTYHSFYGSLRIDFHESMILHMMFPVCNSYSLSFCLVKSAYFLRLLWRVMVLKSSQPSASSQGCLILPLCCSGMLIVEHMVVHTDGLIPYFPPFIDNASVTIFMRSTFICACLTSFHRINSQKCNYGVKGWEYFKALNICIVNLTFKRIVRVYSISLIVYNCTYFTKPSLDWVIFIIISHCQLYCKKNCALFNLHFCD